MQTFSQTFTGAQTWTLNVPGRYFVTLASTNPVNVRFYKAGRMLDLGAINGLSAGLECFDIEFDKVEIDATAADTIQVGIGNGNARYNRQTITITSNRQPVTSTFSNTQKTVTNASGQLVAANANRQYLLIQNKDAAGNVYIAWGGAATTAAGIKIPPGGSFEQPATQSTQAIFAIGDIASNANVVVVEG